MIASYGVWRMKKFMGRSFKGIIRSTFLIGPTGKIEQIWTKSKPKATQPKPLRISPRNSHSKFPTSLCPVAQAFRPEAFLGFAVVAAAFRGGRLLCDESLFFLALLLWHSHSRLP